MAFGVGNKYTDTITVTDQMIQDFARCTGDYNPIHMDEEFAKKTSFGRRICHGLLTAGFISRVLAMKLEDEGIYLAQTLKFMKPVFIGDTVTVDVTITAYREKSAIGVADTIVRNQNNEVVLKGEATIMLNTKVKKQRADA
jgi:3-hydroxybutyryl-CoA dehydratase